MRTVGIILLFSAIALFDLPKLIRERKKKEIAVYSFILGGAFLLTLLHILDFELWSPNRLITEVIRLIFPS